jgi:deoxycytidine triphosphate deaminase
MTTYKLFPDFAMKHIASPASKSKLTNIQQEDIQPNAVDLRLDQVYSIIPNIFEISNDHKKHRGSQEIFPDGEGYFTLLPGSYEIVMENIIHVGEGEAGWVITRSTLNRNGCFITSGLYDSGYHGVMAGVLHVTVGTARIKKGTRVGQYLSFDAESLSSYDGDYGVGKEHDKKYGA